MYMERYTKNAKLIIYGVVKKKKKIMISISENQNQNQTFNKKRSSQSVSWGQVEKRRKKERKTLGK